MKTLLSLSCVFSVLSLFLNFGLMIPVAAAEPARRVNIELRDGSRLIGENVDDVLSFQSQLLGGLKLKAQDLRSINYADTNAATATTTNGDQLAVEFASQKLRVATGFGKVELPVKLIRRVQFSSPGKTGQLPPGLVALWSGEDDGSDSIGGNTAILTDVSFTDGKVGRAFSFNGTSSHINIPDAPALDVGAGDGFTVTVWIKPASVNGIYFVMEWCDYLCAFEIGKEPPNQGVLVASVFDSARRNHFLQAAEGTLVANVFQHVALTYDKSSGVGTLYVNGVIVDRSCLGSFVPLTKGGLRMGYRPGNPGDLGLQPFFLRSDG